MTALGHSRRFGHWPATSGLPPNNGHHQFGPVGPFRAKKQHCGCGRTKGKPPEAASHSLALATAARTIPRTMRWCRSLARCCCPLRAARRRRRSSGRCRCRSAPSAVGGDAECIAVDGDPFEIDLGAAARLGFDHDAAACSRTVFVEHAIGDTEPARAVGLEANAGTARTIVMVDDAAHAPPPERALDSGCNAACSTFVTTGCEPGA